MANHVYTLTDGVSTITLTSSPYIVERYEMRAAKTDANGIYGTVIETILLSVADSSASASQSSYEALERMVNEIVRRKTRPNEEKCYIGATLISDATQWRAHALDASLEPRDDALAVWNGAIIPCVLKIEREYCWRSTEANVSISNGHGSGTSGITFYQCNDSTHDNYANIASNQVSGTLPAPCKVIIQNKTGGPISWRRYFLWVNAFSSPTTFPYTIEGESETSGATTTSGSATSSSGNVAVFTVNTSKTLQYTLSSSMLASAAGRDFRILARFPLVSGQAWVKCQLHTIGLGNPIAETREVLIEDDGYNIKDLGSLPLPPGGFSENWNNHILVLEFRSESSATFNLDFLMIASTDSFIQVDQPAWVIEADEYIHIDSMENQVYTRNASSLDFPILINLDGELVLYPARAQRLHILVDGLSDSALWQTKVFLSYEKRRLTI